MSDSEDYDSNDDYEQQFEQDINLMIQYGYRPWDVDSWGAIEQIKKQEAEYRLHQEQQQASANDAQGNAAEDNEDDDDDDEIPYGEPGDKRYEEDVNIILSYGMKPWDPEAWEFLGNLREEWERQDKEVAESEQ
ncbi:hypothetical protein MP228_004360 [Amoeboaphelidium protococcarum]|nr:hypothetical protein MP228_004360 [Amoeboaphelidium protococcarum]